MKRIFAVFMLTAGICFAEEQQPAIPVAVRAQAELAVFKSGKALPVSITLANGLSKTIRFYTFAVQPNEWNGETINISLVDVYRDGQRRNLYLARPEVIQPLTVSGLGSHPVAPGSTLRVMIDIGKWKIQGGWTEGTYDLIFRMDGIIVDDRVTMSVLSDPVRVLVQ